MSVVRHIPLYISTLRAEKKCCRSGSLEFDDLRIGGVGANRAESNLPAASYRNVISIDRHFRTIEKLRLALFCFALFVGCASFAADISEEVPSMLGNASSSGQSYNETPNNHSDGGSASVGVRNQLDNRTANRNNGVQIHLFDLGVLFLVIGFIAGVLARGYYTMKISKSQYSDKNGGKK